MLHSPVRPLNEQLSPHNSASRCRFSRRSLAKLVDQFEIDFTVETSRLRSSLSMTTNVVFNRSFRPLNTAREANKRLCREEFGLLRLEGSGDRLVKQRQTVDRLQKSLLQVGLVPRQHRFYTAVNASATGLPGQSRRSRSNSRSASLTASALPATPSLCKSMLGKPLLVCRRGERQARRRIRFTEKLLYGHCAFSRLFSIPQ
ncbi:hypothetical protein D3H35_28075 [Cohnella faecalis]|uniref:Uncharacterized protein n=1 Tax=Cohnella faecalis TaxID=2315694 RepID=A0A398CCR9_9BACL|nr:hypothetical protein D3H35_28075 [Cohnella faecalis]